MHHPAQQPPPRGHSIIIMSFHGEAKQQCEPVRTKFMKGMRSNTAYYESTHLDDPAPDREDAQTEVQHRMRADSHGNGFLHSLITKIKSVERVTSGSNSQAQLKLFQQGAVPPKNTKNTHSQAQFQHKYHFSSYNEKFTEGLAGDGRQRREKERSCSLLEEEVGRLRAENEAMREKIRQQNRMLVSSQTKLSRVERELQEKQKTIANFQDCMLEKQRFFTSELAELTARLQETELQNEQLHYTLTHTQLQLQSLHPPTPTRSPTLALHPTLDEVIFPSESHQLLKTQQEVRQLKIDLVTQQKKMLASYNQLRKKKDAEIELLRRSFSRNLNHYKELIVKCTTKGDGKRQEDCEDTTIMEISSADSS